MVWYWYGAVFRSFYYLIKEMTQCYLNSLERHPVLKIYHYKAFFVRLSFDSTVVFSISSICAVRTMWYLLLI